jgi:hypothetical protein
MLIIKILISTMITSQEYNAVSKNKIKALLGQASSWLPMMAKPYCWILYEKEASLMQGLAFCDDWAEKFAARYLDDLSLSENLEFHQHVAECSMCAAVYATYNLLEACIRALPQSSPLSSLISQLQQVQHNKHDPNMSYHASKGSFHAEAISCPKNRLHGSSTTDIRLLQISLRCVNKFMEITLDSLESAELAVEDGVGTVLLDLFETVAIDEVSINFTLDESMEQQFCTLQIDVRCPFKTFPFHPEELENIEFAVEDRISSVLVELFGEVIVDDVRIDYPQLEVRE